MLSNFCEDKRFNDNITRFHEKTLQTYGIPEWVSDIECPFCNKNLPMRSIRSIAMKFNARNIGDIVLEFFCVHCSRMDTLYFKGEANNVTDFINILSGNKKTKNEPFIEEEMYKKGYNNIAEKMTIGEIK